MWIRVLEIPLLSQLACDVNILENCLDLRAEEKELTKPFGTQAVHEIGLVTYNGLDCQ